MCKEFYSLSFALLFELHASICAESLPVLVPVNICRRLRHAFRVLKHRSS